MKSRLIGAVCAGFFSLITTSSNAALVDNGGGLIYDDCAGYYLVAARCLKNLG